MNKKRVLRGLAVAGLLILIIILLRILFGRYTYQYALIYLFLGGLVTSFLVDGLLQLPLVDYLRRVAIFSVLFGGAVMFWFFSSNTGAPEFYFGLTVEIMGTILILGLINWMPSHQDQRIERLEAKIDDLTALLREQTDK